MLYIVCLNHCMYVCYMFIKYQSINQSTFIMNIAGEYYTRGDSRLAV